MATYGRSGNPCSWYAGGSGIARPTRKLRIDGMCAAASSMLETSARWSELLKLAFGRKRTMWTSTRINLSDLSLDLSGLVGLLDLSEFSALLDLLDLSRDRDCRDDRDHHVHHAA